MSKNIGIVLAQPPSYSETFFNSKIRGLQEHGMEVTLFVQKSDPNFNLCKVHVAPRVVSKAPLQFFYLVRQYMKLVPHISRVSRFITMEREQGVNWTTVLKKLFLNSHVLTANLDWLHFGFATMALERENLAHAIGAKMAVSFRGYDIKVYPIKHPNCYDFLWQRVDKVHSISNYLRNEALQLGLRKKTPYKIITPAVSVSELPMNTSEGTFNSPIELITVARLHWIKGLDVAIKAMKLLKNEGIAFRYIIIGEGTQKDFERYAFMAHILGLADEVHFEGKLSHTETLKRVAGTDIYLQPSLNEGFCNAVLEAQAMGKLCIASKVGGLPENILEDQTGLLFESDSPKALAKRFKS